MEVVAQTGRLIPFFESCVLGGASVINGCVHALGSKSRWDIELNRFSLGFDEVTKAYEEIYTKSTFCLRKKIKLRFAPQNTLDRSFFRALEKLGFLKLVYCPQITVDLAQ